MYIEETEKKRGRDMVRETQRERERVREVRR
jgi:hypothetical protein